MERINPNFNQKIKLKIYFDRSVRALRIGSFCLCVSLFTFTETCLAAERVDEVKPLVTSCCSGGRCKTVAAAQSAERELAEVLQEKGPSLHTTVDVESVYATPALHAESSQKMIFKIGGMCCPTEADILKGVLHPLLNKEDREAYINFDLVNSKLIVESKNGNLPTKEEIIKAVTSTGMDATLWNEHVKQAQEGKKTFWEKYGRYALNLTSAASLATGLVIHAINNGANAAFGGGVGEDKAYYSEHPPIASMVFYSTAMVAASWYILPKALRAIKRLRPDTNVLMTSATVGAIAMNSWFEGATSMYLFSAAELLENWNMQRTRKAIRVLMELAPSTAQVVNADCIKEQLVENIPIGTTIIVRPGEKIPLDSVLILGSTFVNQAPITGESMPIQKEPGDKLFAGTINEDSVIQCRVTKAASDSTLASIIRKVEEAQSRRAKSDQWIERFSQYYVPAMMSTSLMVAIIPPLATNSPWYPWIYKGLQLLVVSCPCSLTISTPVSIVAGIAAAARAGILIKGGVYLENAAHIEAFAMDKTGTITTGSPIVQNIIPLSGYDTKRLLWVASALESHSDHPLARAIQRKAKEDGITVQPAESFQLFKGKGGQGYIGGELFWAGSHRFLHEKVGDNESPAVHKKIKELEAAGHSIVAIGTEQVTCGLISIADTIRRESKQAIQDLKRANLNGIVMLTGDNEGAARAIATSVGIDEYYAELLPEDKVHQIEVLMEKYKRVAMVGDGINDAPAMAVSSLGIAMGAAGSDAAIETADIALMSDDLGKLAWLVKHSRNTLKIIKQNVALSLLVKGAFSVAVFTNKTTLWMAVLADMGTSLGVVSNGLRLLNSNDKTASQRQSILAAERTSAPALAQEEVDPLLPLSRAIAHKDSTYGSTE